jgi:GT2 family glycosyltransferase
VKKIGGFRKGYEGSQDYDLLLRYSREIDHANIVHIPKVLYHWRMVVGSTALASGEKSYTTDAGIKALEDHFKVLEKEVTVEQGKHANIYKVNWPSVDTDKNEPLVSLIIPTYNGYEITKQAIDSILEKTIYQNYEILLVDNNSNDEIALAYFEELDQHEKVTVLRYPYPFNYSAINNFAAKQAKGEIIGLVNNDVEVISPEWLTEMVSHALRDDIGCVGAMLYFENDTIQHAGVITGIGGVAGHSHKHFKRGEHGYFSRLNLVQNISAVTAACLLVRKTVFEQVNGLNEKDLTVAFNDVDFCLKVQAAGYRNLWTPYAELYHYESISRGAEDNPEKVARFNTEVVYMLNTWGTDKKPDPCYSPNLTNKREDFSVGK